MKTEKDWSGAPRSQEEARKDSPQNLQVLHGLADTLTLDIWPPEVR